MDGPRVPNQDPDPLDDPEFFNLHPTGPTPTSRTSVQKVLSVTSQFDQYKIFLLEEMGWEGILKLRPLARINLKFSKWVMNRVDTTNRSIIMDKIRSLRFTDADVYKVFGIPCGQLDISLHEQPSETTVNIIRGALGMPEKGHQILKAAEKVLCRPLSEKFSSTIEKDSFKMALVIFVMGQLLAPSSKHDAAPIDYWSAIANPQTISDFNWCEYVLQDLMKAVSKLKLDILNNKTVTHLEGCHLFLQVFYLDNVDLGIYNLDHNTLPRISAFDLQAFRRMILQCSNPSKLIEDYSAVRIQPPAEICYKRALWDSTPDIQTPRVSSHTSKQPTHFIHASSHHPKHTTRESSTSFSNATSRHNTPPAPQPATISPHRVYTANDYAIYMKEKYPNLHNAISFKMIADTRESIMKENLRFLDKIAPKLQNKCTCCVARSIPCLLQRNFQEDVPNSNLYSTPAAKSALKNRRLYANDSEVDTPNASSTNKRKGIQCSDDSQTAGTSSHRKIATANVPPCKSNHDSIKSWADTIVGGILMCNDDISVPNGSVILGQTSPHPKDKLVINHSHYVVSHWSSGTTIDFPSIALQDRLSLTVYRLPIAEKERFSITHTSPRFITLSCESIAEQIVDTDLMDHEVLSLIFRRLRQIDEEFLYPQNSGPSRHYIEPDFSTSVLASEQVWSLKSVQDQFFGKLVPYNISHCRLWHVPALLESGWVIFTWDMLSKTILILDAKSGLTSKLKKMHEAVANRLHVALFSCIYKFFSGWHVDCANWKKKFPFITTSIFPKNESGVCAVHIARHFSGTSLEEILSHDGLTRERGFLLHQILIIKGNISMLPQPVQEALGSN